MVLAVCGPIAAGKSYLAERAAGWLGCDRTGFGLHLRRLAEDRGLVATRAVLQELGERAVVEDCEGFVSAVMAASHWTEGQSIVIDGVRHVQVAECLKRLAGPSEFVLMYVETARDVREARYSGRPDAELYPLRDLERHSTELEVPRLRHVADVVVDGEKGADAMLRSLRRLV